MNDPTSETLRLESIRHMRNGLELIGQGQWHAAMHQFNRAIHLREQLPWRDEPASAWLLAAAWINRSDMLRKRGHASLLPEAVRSLDRAIEAMQYVVLEENPAHVDRLLLAWINRGTTQGELGKWSAAAAAFSQAEQLLDRWGERITPDRLFLAGMLRLNRARVFLDRGQAIPAWQQAREGVRLFDELPQPPPAESIHARCILCQALAAILDEPNGADLPGDWIAAATDAIEEALALAKSTDGSAVHAADLIRYGAKIYRVCQPHFLGEFLQESLASGPCASDQRLLKEMRGELLLARRELELRVLAAAHDTEYVAKQSLILHSMLRAEQFIFPIPHVVPTLPHVDSIPGRFTRGL